MARQATADVTVVGSGMAGLAAAMEAIQADADVLILEKGDRAGGSTYLSGGALYTYDYESMRQFAPNGDPELQRLVAESAAENIEWLQELGVDVEDLDPLEYFDGDIDDVHPECRDMVEEVTETRRNLGYIDTAAFVAHMVESFIDEGGEFHLETPMEELLTEDGAITGVEAAAEGERLRIESDSVVLATGGFQGNEYLVEQFITDADDDVWVRANRWSTGDGLEAARDVGAKTSKGMHETYGHTMPAPPASFTPDQYVEATSYYGPYAISVNGDGERYTDESESVFEDTLTLDALKRADGRVYHILDQDLYDSTVHLGNVGSMIESQRELGATVEEVDSIEAVGERLWELGVHGDRAVETITEFNEKMRADDWDKLTPSRRRNHVVIDTPPFYIVELQPSITYTNGGLHVNTDMEVLRRSASGSMYPHGGAEQERQITRSIDGLYAAGVDIGNFHRRQNIGPLIGCLGTGRVAGENAAEHAHSA